MLEFRNQTVDLHIQEIDAGLLISQAGRSYIARRWRLTKDVVNVIEMAIKSGLVNLIQNGHPQESKLLPNGDGADYITFSDDPNHRWVFVLDMDSAPSQSKLQKVKFNKKYKHYLRDQGISCPPEWRSPQELVVNVSDLRRALDATKLFWSSLGQKSGVGAERGQHAYFVDEEDLHSHIFQNWNECPLSDTLMMPISKHLIGSVAARIGEIDLLTTDRRGNTFVIELKNRAVFNTGGETPDMQLIRYMTHPDIVRSARVAGGQVYGVLIAQEMDYRLRSAVRRCQHPIVAYEISKAESGMRLQEVSRSERFMVPL
jgi:hypothetical protein